MSCLQSPWLAVVPTHTVSLDQYSTAQCALGWRVIVTLDCTSPHMLTLCFICVLMCMYRDVCIIVPFLSAVFLNQDEIPPTHSLLTINF